MHRAAIVLAAFLSLAASLAPAQSLSPPPAQSKDGEKPKDKAMETYLSGVTQRGRALYAYDQAAWRGTDAFFALNPDTKGLSRYVARKTAAGWVVSFGKWNDTHDHFLVAYEATQVGATAKYEAKKLDPPVEAKDEVTDMERALELATSNFQGQKRPYNTAILPAPGGNLYVYIYPGQVKEGIWPIGGDTRFTISADGKKIVEKHAMHNTIQDMEYKAENTPVAGVHSHIMTNVPEDTDVLYVLTRRPSIPEYIAVGTDKGFVVSRDGKIEAVTPCEGDASGLPCNLTQGAPSKDEQKPQH